MEENKKKEELQSRRGFFKSAAKKALPILAAVALANVPQIMKAAEAETGCNRACSYSCKGGCSGGCQTQCAADGCGHSCAGSCRGKCYSMCTDSCHRSSR